MDLRKSTEYADYVLRFEEKLSTLDSLVQTFQNKYPYPSEREQGWIWDALIPYYEAAQIIASEALANGYPDLALAVLRRAEHVREVRAVLYARWNP